MGNGTWVCFECREVVRRPTHHAEAVPCPVCGERCNYLGTKIQIPAKRSIKAWRDLRDWFREMSQISRERIQIDRVRQRHQMEREIAKLEALPSNEGRASMIRRLRRELGEL